ncbi:hypothetical protein ACZ87_02268 [Candidatus Erwinia dacicola]|uniref:Uncharacterized protein n=1 Tax=Candidatus Erwinia dacicola TaxID=252393 RepID=A0A328TJX7_9GAMM|nr:hypothetical protein ACZ87_02268 [Candidatus Erwinia dacicola]
MQYDLVQAIAPLMAANKTLNRNLRTDRYTLSNGLMGFAADNHRHPTPSLPVKTGFHLF